MQYQMVDFSIVEGMNTAKEVLASTLLRDGVITAEQAKIINEQYAIVTSPPNVLGRILEKLLGEIPNKHSRVLAVRV